MKITWLGHSAFRLDTGTASILIDPFLSGSPVFEGNVEDVSRGVTHIVLTHGHGDHLGDTVDIAKATGATVISNADLCSWLAGKGVEKVDPTNTGGTVKHEGFTVSFVQAHHSSAFQTEDGVSHALGNPNGVVIAADGAPVVYHMGDTDIFGDMALVQELYEPDIGIVPIGDRFTMGGKVAALACRRFFKFKTIVPCHYGTFPLIDQTADTFREALGPDASKLKMLKVGEAFEA